MAFTVATPQTYDTKERIHTIHLNNSNLHAAAGTPLYVLLFLTGRPDSSTLCLSISMKATGASIRPYRQLTIFEASGIGNLKENTSTAKPLNQSRSGSHGSETLGESCVEGSSKDHPIICCDLSEDNSDVSSIGPLPLQQRSTGGGAKGFSQSTSDIHATGCSMLRGGERAEVSGNESTGESRTPTCDTDTEEDGRTDNANSAISMKLHKESACTGAKGNHGPQDGVTNLNFSARDESSISSADPASKARQTNASRGSSVAMVTKEQLEKGQAQPMAAGSVAMVTEKQLEKVDETTISKSTVSSVTSERHPSGGCGTAELPESPISGTRKRKRVTRRLYSRRSKGTDAETRKCKRVTHHKRSKEAEGKGDVVKVSDDTPTIDSSCAVEPWRCENEHDGDSTPELERIPIGRECKSETCMSNSTPEAGVATMDDTPTVATPTLDLHLVMSVKSPIKKKCKKVTRKLNSEHLTPKQTVGAIDAQDDTPTLATPTLTTPTLDCSCVYASGDVLRKSHDVCEDYDATNNEESENAVSLIKRKRKKASYRSFNRCPAPECPTPIECSAPEIGVAFKSTTPSSTPKVGVACPDVTPTSAITSCVSTGIDESDSSNMSRDIISKSATNSSKQKMGVSCPDATPTSAITSRVDTEELTLFAGDDESDSSSMSEVEHPLPSTPQQKEARRLGRLKQLQEMRARETMEARRERAMKRRGESSPSKRPQRTTHKRVTWMEEGSLVTVVNCPPSDLQ